MGIDRRLRFLSENRSTRACIVGRWEYPLPVVEIAVCQSCESLRVQLRDTLASLAAAQEKLAEREAKIQQFSIQLREALKLIDLQRADLLRYRADPEPTRPRMEPNVPERVDREQLQKAFERVLAAQPELAANVANDDAISPRDADATLGRAATPKKGKQPRKHHPHGRRSLDLSKLPVERIEFDPPEVIASNGVGWMRIGEEVSHRVGYRPAQYFDLQIVRTKWARIVLPLAAAIPEGEAADETPEPAPIIVAPVPENVWPRIMGDPSAIANVIISKYGDSLPLNRQEQISVRHGFELPRSTQCDWLLAARQASYRIVDAMHAEARNRAFCIATDATGVEVRAKGGCDRWHLFVFIADCDHIIFDHAPSHDGATVTRMMKDFTGYVLADAAGIYNTLYDDHDMTEVACWYHARRYFWRGLASDRERALEPLALIAKLFQIDRECRSIVMPERTQMRASRAGPILNALDEWIAQNKAHVDPRGPLDQAIGYCTNQREPLRRFLEDGRLPLHNNVSEQQLRNAVLGLHNWKWFANETGLKLYTHFRSLIASCALHGINPQRYLEQMLRLAPGWPVNRMIEISPKYWMRTLERLDVAQRQIVTAPWDLEQAPIRSVRPASDRRQTRAA